VRTRPAGGIVLVGVLAWISGILQLFAGVILILASDADITGWVHILVGLITFPVCLALFRARASARIIVTIVFLLEVVGAVFSLIELRLLATPAVTSAILAVFGLILLYTPSANASFRIATAERRNVAHAAR
jgi:hypothetical protein